MKQMASTITFILYFIILKVRISFSSEQELDILFYSVSSFSPPPTICGYNTGQHMWVPACPTCVTINIDIDTASTATTRSWTIRVTQYECGTNNLNIPEENCLQYHTAQTGSDNLSLSNNSIVTEIFCRINCQF